jgi:uncharacterized protein YbjT (DUF2867 family)
MTDPVQVHVIGASGRTGAAVCRSLLADPSVVVAVVRNPAKWQACGIDVVPRIADLTDPTALHLALHDATHIVCCAHARFAAAVIAAAPADARFVFLGSTRKFTRWPDAHAKGVLEGEATFLASRRTGVMLHPTMIYGAQGEDNVQRLAALLRRLPFVPLPAHGKALVQPVHQDDLVRVIRRVLAREWYGPQSIVVAGLKAISYADFVRAVADAADLPPPRVISVPGWLLIAAATLLQYVPLLPRVEPAEVRRLMEDKAFDIMPMIAALGIQPMSLEEGLRRTFLAGPQYLP